jgi:hypothetical protein
MDDAIITGLGDYLMRSGRLVGIARPAGSGSFLAVLDDGETVRAWDETGKCLSGDRELDIIGRYPREGFAS